MICSFWKIPLYTLERKRVDMQIVSYYYYKSSFVLRESGTIFWEPGRKNWACVLATPWASSGICLIMKTCLSAPPVHPACDSPVLPGIKRVILSHSGLGFRKPLIARTPHLGSPTSPSGIKLEFESSAWLLCFSLSYLWTWWGRGPTCKSPQTPVILSTFIPPSASGSLALAETLLQCVPDRMLRTGSSNWHGDPLTRK